MAVGIVSSGIAAMTPLLVSAVSAMISLLAAGIPTMTPLLPVPGVAVVTGSTLLSARRAVALLAVVVVASGLSMARVLAAVAVLALPMIAFSL